MATRFRVLLSSLTGGRGKSGDTTPAAGHSGDETLAFDGDWYVRAYPEVVDAIDSGLASGPEDHYRRIGVQEGNNPHRFFSETLYRRYYPDVEAAIAGAVFRSGFEHFRRDGDREGRRSNPMPVDERWYCDEHPEVLDLLQRGVYADAADHYRLEGCLRGWDPHEAFSERWYLEKYPEVSEGLKTDRYLCGYQHLLENGLTLGLKPHPLFDEADYRSRHGDVDAMVRRGEIDCSYRHLIEDGLRQGREWKQISDLEKLRRATERLAEIRLGEFLASGRRIDLSPDGRPEVSVILVLFGRAELTLQCLRSLELVEDVCFEVVIVDNCSTDRTGELLARVDGVRVLDNLENVGFTLAANQGAEAAGAGCLLFLNNDTEVLPFSLRAGLNALQSKSGIGAVGGMILRLDGFLQEAGCIVWNDGQTAAYGGGEDPGSGAFLFPREVDYCSGVFLLTPTTVFRELEGFDDRFAPAYFEDVDYCFRLRDHGLKTLYEPEAKVIHFGSASFEKDPSFDPLLTKNQEIFFDLHREVLAGALVQSQGSVIAASRRGHCNGRILWIDDRVPFPRHGSGSPRTRGILRVLVDLGYRVTFFCAEGGTVEGGQIRDRLELGDVEFITEDGIDGLKRFWERRAVATDIVIISRPHNMLSALGLDLRFSGKPLIYDAEALISSKVSMRREVLGHDDPRDVGISKEDELAMASRADEVWAVNRKDARVFSEACDRVTVVGPALSVKEGGLDFEERSGLLFVGRLQEAWSPNVDGLSWFLKTVYPMLNEIVGETVGMTVVGAIGKVDLPRPEGVRFVGALDDLTDVYRKSRIFVAPARFSAGIPWKVCEAAAHGLPVVASSDLVEQLGWKDGVEVLDGGRNDPGFFARQCAMLLGQRSIWGNLKVAALNRIHDEYSWERLCLTIESSLGSSLSDQQCSAARRKPQRPPPLSRFALSSLR